VHKEVSEFGIITMPVSYLATRPPAKSSEECDAQNQNTSCTNALLCIPVAYSALKVHVCYFLCWR